MKATSARPRDDERGIAIVVALFMMLAMSVIGTSLMFVSQTETLSTHNYRLMSQARYGAESGVHKAANYLLNSYTPPGTVADPLTNYDTSVSPVTYNGQPVVLSWDTDDSNYPVSSVRSAFASAFSGTNGQLDVKDAPVRYRATATLKSMRQITDAYSLQPVTLQTWDIVGEGRIRGARRATVEVASTVERQTYPVYAYAAFATYDGCEALSFAGGATTNSYDSSAALVGGVPVTSDSGGNVGTNGNLTEVGNPTTINGSLSTPRTGVGACTSNNVTAQTISGAATVTGGLTQLSQPITYPTPALPNPLPPTTNVSFTQNGGCPAGVPSCTVSANGATLDAAGGTLTLGNITTVGGSNLQITGGTYVVNSITMAGNSKITVVPGTGPVVFNVVGQGVTTPITITGQGLVNGTYNPSNLQFVYAGTGNISMAGGEQSAALFYAPNATGAIAGGADLWGAIVVRRLTATGGASIHYDRRLQTDRLAAGNYMLSAFTWKNY
jgi:Tfp pilus assembly protein PilX